MDAYWGGHRCGSLEREEHNTIQPLCRHLGVRPAAAAKAKPVDEGKKESLGSVASYT